MGNKPGKEGLIYTDFEEMIRDPKFTEEELDNWYQNFTTKRGVDYITTEEFVEIYDTCFTHRKGSVFAQNVFRLIDLNNDNRIDFDELAIALGITMRGSSEDKLRWMFRFYDRDGDEQLKKIEMKTVVMSLLKMSTKGKNNKEIEVLADDSVAKIFLELDSNNDGALSVEEFMQVKGKSDVFMDVFEKCLSIANKYGGMEPDINCE